MQEKIRKWSEHKIMLLSKYAQPFANLVQKHNLKAVYIDAFAGIGEFVSERSGKVVLGSPRAILEVSPPFKEYYFIEMNHKKLERLRELEKLHNNVYVKGGDCNYILQNEVFPNVRYEDYKRGLCFLDPYGMHLDWKVIEKAGSMRSIEIFLNFATMDIKRNVLRHNPKKIETHSIERMNLFWGDDSWRSVASTQESAVQGDLFGQDEEKTSYNDVVNEYAKRLKTKANFKYVSTAVPMLNSKGNILYHLLFATQNRTGLDIVNDIFKKYLKTDGCYVK